MELLHHRKIANACAQLFFVLNVYSERSVHYTSWWLIKKQQETMAVSEMSQE
jgi:hypothetical protein